MKALIPREAIERKILLIRGEKLFAPLRDIKTLRCVFPWRNP
jgi:hypothetical protein